MEMEGQQYPFQISCLYCKFNKHEEEPDFCLTQCRVLRQSEEQHFVVPSDCRKSPEKAGLFLRFVV